MLWLPAAGAVTIDPLKKLWLIHLLDTPGLPLGCPQVLRARAFPARG